MHTMPTLNVIDMMLALRTIVFTLHMIKMMCYV